MPFSCAAALSANPKIMRHLRQAPPSRFSAATSAQRVTPCDNLIIALRNRERRRAVPKFSVLVSRANRLRRRRPEVSLKQRPRQAESSTARPRVAVRRPRPAASRLRVPAKQREKAYPGHACAIAAGVPVSSCEVCLCRRMRKGSRSRASMPAACRRRCLYLYTSRAVLTVNSFVLVLAQDKTT